MGQKGLDMLEPKKEIVAITIDCFRNKDTGEFAYQKMGETYADGISCNKVFDGRYWKLISSTKIDMLTFIKPKTK